MLRNTGERLKLKDKFSEIDITICKIYGSTVKVGVHAPANLGIYLNETYQRMQADLQQKVESYYHKTCRNQQSVKLSARDEEKQKALENIRVLLVEDAAIIRIANCEFIQSLGCKVDVAEDGRKAIDMLHNPYDLILLDIGLPDISGLEICKWLRSRLINLNTVVVFLTAYGEGMLSKCKKAGGNDFAVKPLSIEKLLKLVKRWLPAVY